MMQLIKQQEKEILKLRQERKVQETIMETSQEDHGAEVIDEKDAAEEVSYTNTMNQD